MCSRYTLKLSGDDIAHMFELDGDHSDDTDGENAASSISAWPGPRFNIAPTDDIPVFIESEKNGERRNRLELARWGLILGGKPTPYPLINTRVESLHGSGNMAGVFAKRRALIPATGYYEWQKLEKVKQPYYFTANADEPFAFAGIYSWSKNDAGEWKLTASIITRPPTPAAEVVHNRMPMVLPRSFWSDWVDPGRAGDDLLADAALHASDAAVEALRQYPVARAVGSTRVEGEQLIEPITL